MGFTDIDKKVIRGIRHAVDVRGGDWRYPNGKLDGERIEGFTRDPDWVGQAGGCVNLLTNGTPACIIGFCAVDQGLPTERVSSAFIDAKRWGVSRGIGYAMGRAQATQDYGYDYDTTWEAFVDTLLEYGYTHEQIDAALKED